MLAVLGLNPIELTDLLKEEKIMVYAKSQMIMQMVKLLSAR